jgi:hypothetical protein
MTAEAKPQFASMHLPKPDEKAIDAYTKSRRVPVLHVPEGSPRAPTQTLRTEVPDYLAEALRIECAKSQCTIRYLMLKALRDAGWEVRDEDIAEDRRRTTTAA